MLELKHSIRINTSPEKVFDWLAELPTNYKAWHPGHIVAKWLNKTEDGVGTVFYAEQELGGGLGGYTFTVTEYEPGKVIKYKPNFPRSLNLSFGSFEVEPVEDGCIFTAVLRFRFGFIMPKFFIDNVYQHIKEEGENLKKILEGDNEDR